MSRKNWSKKDNGSGKQGRGSSKSNGGKGSHPKKRHYSSTKKSSKKSIEKNTDEVRLNKYIANSGVCSRRDADIYIAAGNVIVNGEVITEMGYKVKFTDVVKFDGRMIKPEKKVYVLLNKPKGFITTTSDERGRRTVMDLVQGASKSRIVPVGRLDRNTMGLLLFTNDGEMAKKLTHPSYGVRKLYHVVLDKSFTLPDLHKVREGLLLDDGEIKVDDISFIEGANKNELGIKLHSGKNRIVRRIFEYLGYEVIKLDRVVFAGLTKKELPRGTWRHLTQQEIINLQMI